VLFHRDAKIRHAMRWYTRMGRRVWPFEVTNFLFRDRRIANGPTLEQFWGAPQDADEEAMASKQKERSIASFNAEVRVA
jgi:anaerobic magnesium-protoporphyrin IX monomethyl ester cyclase